MLNGRCRIHGGKSTGPRTPKGIARMTAANTKHGKTTAPKRAQRLYVRTLIKRTRLVADARRLRAYLPPDMAARLAAGPAELWAPVHPSNLPFVAIPNAQSCDLKIRPAAARHARGAGGPGTTTRPEAGALAAERQAARAEAAALAPWRHAIAFARTAKRAVLAARRAALATRRAARAAKRIAQGQPRVAGPNPPPAAAEAPRPDAVLAWPPAPTLPWSECSPLERELAARKSGLRAYLNVQRRDAAPPPQHQPGQNQPAQNHASTFSRSNLLNPEPAAMRGPKPDSTFPRSNLSNDELGAPPVPTPASTFSRSNLSNDERGASPGQTPDSTFSRSNLLNPEPAATAGSKPDSTFPRSNPVKPGPAAASRLAHLTPIKAAALRSTPCPARRNRTCDPCSPRDSDPRHRHRAGSCRRPGPRRPAR